MLTGSATSAYQIIDHDPARVGAWMQTQGAGYWREGSTCIGLEREGELVAGTMYDGFNGASILAHIAIRGPITRRWLWCIFAYPFLQLACRTIIGLIAQENEKSQALARHLGFRLHTRLPECDPSGDLQVYLMRREECRFLRKPFAQEA